LDRALFRELSICRCRCYEKKKSRRVQYRETLIATKQKKKKKQTTTKKKKKNAIRRRFARLFFSL